MVTLSFPYSQEHPDAAAPLWHKIIALNNAVASTMAKLTLRADASDYAGALHLLGQASAVTDPAGGCATPAVEGGGAKELFESLRSTMVGFPSGRR